MEDHRFLFPSVAGDKRTFVPGVCPPCVDPVYLLVIKLRLPVKVYFTTMGQSINLLQRDIWMAYIESFLRISHVLFCTSQQRSRSPLRNIFPHKRTTHFATRALLEAYGHGGLSTPWDVLGRRQLSYISDQSAFGEWFGQYHSGLFYFRDISRLCGAGSRGQLKRGCPCAESKCWFLPTILTEAKYVEE